MKVIQVEGNIAAGKSTFIHFIQNMLSTNVEKNETHTSICRKISNEDIEIKELSNNIKKLKIKIIEEPISEWQKNSNIFQKYYSDPSQYAETFQTFVFGTLLLEALLSQIDRDTDVVVMERSLYSCVYCFGKLLLTDHLISETYHETMRHIYDRYRGITIHPDILVYFQTKNEDVHLLKKRILERDRKEEKNISTQYLLKLNNIYEDIIENGKEFQSVKKIYIPSHLVKETQQEKYFVPILRDVITELLSQRRDKKESK